MHCFRFWSLFASRSPGGEECDVGRVSEGFYSYMQKDKALWVELEILSNNKMNYLLLSKKKDRVDVAHTQVDYSFNAESCLISFTFDSTNSEVLYVPNASSSETACEIPATKHEGTVGSRSRKIAFGDKKLRFSKVEKSSIWNNVVMFANLHKIKLTPDDLKLLETKAQGIAVPRSHFGKNTKGFKQFNKVMDRMPVRDDEILTDVGWLRVSRRMSESAFGIVFEAEWEQAEKSRGKNVRVGLKVSLPGKEKDFIRESEIMQLMNGEEGFPDLYGKQLRGQHLYYLSYLPLQSLQRSLEAQRFPTKAVLSVAVQRLHRLAALHSKGLVMACLSLDNVLLDKTGNVYLTELGLAGKLDDRSLREEVDNYMHLVRLVRESGLSDTGTREGPLWQETADYIAARGRPDFKKLEGIFMKYWSNRID